VDGNLPEYFRTTVLKLPDNHKIRNRCVQLRIITSNYIYSPYTIQCDINIKVQKNCVIHYSEGTKNSLTFNCVGLLDRLKSELIITKYEIINCNEIAFMFIYM
jgi:hypothetical protein